MDSKGWQVFSKTGGGRFEQYQRLPFVIVSGKKYPSLFITDTLYKLLGSPSHITIMTRGSNVGLRASANKEGYKVQRFHKTDTPYISAAKFINSMGIARGAYEAHIESGPVAVFDTQDRPKQA